MAAPSDLNVVKNPDLKFVFVAGSTASGKSNWALEAAIRENAAIINCDSVQAYEGFEIGAAAPTAHDRLQAPHFLYNFVKYPEKLTAGKYRQYFLDLITKSTDHKKFLVVGGTGFYFQALEKGMLAIPAADPTLVAKYENEIVADGGGLRLWRLLQEWDPVQAEKISPQDHYRIVRALVVRDSGGRRLSELMLEKKLQAPEFPYPFLKTGLKLSRESLRSRVEVRSRQMLDSGLIAEVESLLERGQADWSPLQSVGYHEVCGYLRGEIPLADLPARMTVSTLQLAKRQRTWFQREQDIHWFLSDSDSAREDFLKMVAGFFNHVH